MSAMFNKVGFSFSMGAIFNRSVICNSFKFLNFWNFLEFCRNDDLLINISNLFA